MYKNSYNKLRSFADQIADSAKEHEVSVQQSNIRTTGLMEGIRRARTRAEDAMEPEKTQDEILAEYMKSVGLTEEDLQAPTSDEPRRPTTRPWVSLSENTSERDLLALAIYGEAGAEGEQGMLAVGSVMANRVGDGRFGESFKEVLLAPGQFSMFNALTGHAGGEGALNIEQLTPSPEAYAVADKILSGDYESPVGSATHYYNPKAATPPWGRTAGGRWQTLGNHVFGYAN